MDRNRWHSIFILHRTGLQGTKSVFTLRPFSNYSGGNNRWRFKSDFQICECLITISVYTSCNNNIIIGIVATLYIVIMQVINITSCQVCPGGCRNMTPIPPFPSLPVQCPPIPGEPSCMCQHPNGIIDLTPYAKVDGTAGYE